MLLARSRIAPPRSDLSSLPCRAAQKHGRQPSGAALNTNSTSGWAVGKTRDALRPRSGTSAKAVLLTVLGQFVLPRGAAVWTQTLVEALGAVGIERQNTRQALSRLTQQGLVVGRRDGRRVRRQLSEDGIVLLESGARRIADFGSKPIEWGGRWLVVLCSVPEEYRSKRHLLRSRLAFAGFGFLAPGVAITPHLEREELASAVLRDLDLAGTATVFRAELGELTTATDLLHRGWDLASLTDEYRSFVRAFQGRAPTTARARFAAMVELVDRWRRFPFIDPEIPAELLPARWNGHIARDVFDDRSRAWDESARAYFETLEHAANRPSSRVRVSS